jgi:hypothetical protein
MPKLTDGNVIWRSKYLPQLFATDFMIEVFNARYPILKGSMKKEFEQMEVWLLAHPARQPKRNWSGFIARWMARAAKFRMNPSRPGPRGRGPGDEGFYRIVNSNPISLDEFFKKIAQERATE